MGLIIRLVSVTVGLGLTVALGACNAPANTGLGQVAPNASTPGWTGRTVVIGSTSTIAGDAAATEMQQKWQIERGR